MLTLGLGYLLLEPETGTPSSSFLRTQLKVPAPQVPPWVFFPLQNSQTNSS